jgi:hypothetical protein
MLPMYGVGGCGSSWFPRPSRCFCFWDLGLPANSNFNTSALSLDAYSTVRGGVSADVFFKIRSISAPRCICQALFCERRRVARAGIIRNRAGRLHANGVALTPKARLKETEIKETSTSACVRMQYSCFGGKKRNTRRGRTKKRNSPQSASKCRKCAVGNR